MKPYWFIAAKNESPYQLGWITFFLALVVIMLGAYTRLTNAGLSCPDWPHCYGFITAPHTTAQIQEAMLNYPTAPLDIKKAWTEMTHRYVAGTEGMLILILSFFLFFHPKVKNRLLGASLICVVLVQVLLGMLTVTEKLKPVIVLSHLLMGISLLSLLWWNILRHFKAKSLPKAPIPPFLAWLAFIIIGLQISLGGWVSTHYAGLACIDFPYCNGTLFPPIQMSQLSNDLISIHMLHRIGALITAIYVAFFSFFLIKNPTYKIYGIHLLLFLFLQIVLGILNIIWLRPIWIALLHQTIGILLLLTALTLLIKVYQHTDKTYGLAL